MNSPAPSIAQLRNQLKQLADLAQGGALPDEHYQAAKARLERQLLDTVMAGGDSLPDNAGDTGETPRLPRKLWWRMLTFVGVVGAGGYAWVGQPAAWYVGPGDASPTVTASAAGHPAAAGSAPHALGEDQIKAMVEGLAAKLRDKPDNPEGWAMLARSYAALKRFDDALPAYRRAIEQAPREAQLYADYADALALTQGRQFDGEPARLVAKALSLAPDNFKALSLSGTMAFDKQNYQEAASLWARALQHAPSDNAELTRQIQSALDDARERAGLPRATATDANRPSIRGTVTLSKALADKVSPEDTVFIYARSAQGPKMPLAIVRKQVKDLPYRFELNDALAMAPQFKLSGYQSVIVAARVSRSGDAAPQKGDWLGQAEAVKVGADDVHIDIADPVR